MTCVDHGGSVCPRVEELLTLAAGAGARARAGAPARRRARAARRGGGPRSRRAGARAGRPAAVPELGDGRLRRPRRPTRRGRCPSSSGSLPGSPAPRPLAAGEAMGIATGGVVPEGADAVVQHERVVENDNTVEIPEPVASGANIRPVGRDVVAGGGGRRRGRAARPGADRRARRRRGRRGRLRAPPARRRADDRHGASRARARRSAPARSTRRTA